MKQLAAVLLLALALAGCGGSGGTSLPPPGNTVAATAPQLAAHTTYTVSVDAVYPPAERCTADARSGPTSFQLGSFTTI